MKNKYLLLLPILLISFAFISATTTKTYGDPIIDNNSIDYVNLVVVPGIYSGVIIVPNVDVEVISIDKVTLCNSSKAYIWSLGHRLAEATFVGNTANFSPYVVLEAGTIYSLLTDEGAETYYTSGSFTSPITGTNINWVSGNNGVADENDSYYYTGGVSDAGHDIQSIVTRNWTISTTPTSGAPLHYDDLITPVEQTQLPSDTITTPIAKFSIFQGINNFFIKIGMWFKNLFSFI